MEVLRTEWLRPLIEKVLNNWLEHPGTEISGVSRSEKIQKPIDHESTLRIRVEPIARCAQLLEWEKGSPLRGIISDSFSRITAIFPLVVVQDYEKRNGKPICRDTAGGILRLRSFEIVISYETREVTLYILDFSVLGSEGSSRIGNPAPIRTCESVQGSVGQICNRKYGQNGHDVEDDGEDGDGSGDSDSSDEGPVQSQVPARRVNALLVQPKDSSPGSHDVPSTQLPRSVVASRLPGNAKEMQRLLNKAPKKTLGTSRPVAAPQRRVITETADDLLRMFQGGKRASAGVPPQVPNRLPERAASVSSRKSTPSRVRAGKPENSPKHEKHIAVRSRDPESATVVPIPAEDSPGRRPPHSDMSAVNMDDSTHDNILTTTSRNGGETHEPPTISTGLKPQDGEFSVSDTRVESRVNGAPSGEKATVPENYQKSSRGNGGAWNGRRKISRREILIPKDQEERIEQQCSLGKSVRWSHRDKIRRRDIFIPKDQEELIESRDSWVPPEPGMPIPQAHVPVALLQHWNDLHAKHLGASDGTQTKQASPPMSQDLLSVSPSSTRSASLVSEWGTSPARPADKFVLPPDSSPVPPAPPARERVLRSSNLQARARPTTERVHPDSSAESPTPDLRNGPTPLRGNQHLSERDEPDPPGNTTSHALNHVCGPSESPFRTSGPAMAFEDASSGSEMEIALPMSSAVESAQEPSASVGDLPDTSQSSLQVAATDRPKTVQAAGTPVSGSSGASASQKSSIVDEPESTQASGDQPRRAPSEILVPGTFNSLGSYPGSQVSNSRRGGDSQVSSNLGEDVMLEKQLTSTLDESLSSIEMSGQQDPFKVAVYNTQNLNSLDERLQVAECSVDASQEPDRPSTALREKRKHDETDQSPPRKRSKVRQESSTSPAHHARARAPAESRSQFLRTLSRRESLIEPTVSEGRKIYDRYVRDYPEYQCDIKTFKRSCRKLLLLHDQGGFTQSPFFDDFVGREPAEYRNYVDECSRHGKAPDSYETYFSKNVTTKRLRKRTLSAKSLRSVVDDNEIRDEDEPEAQEGSPFLAPDQPLEAAADPITTTNDQETSLHIPQESEPGRPLENLIREDQAASDEDELEEFDESHETASIELGDPPHSRKATPHEDDDVQMADAETTSGSDDEEQYPSSSMVKPGGPRRNLSFSEVVEIEESDTEMVIDDEKGQTAEQRERLGGSRDKGKQRLSSPVRYPPWKPPAAAVKFMAENQRGSRMPEDKEWLKRPDTVFKEFQRDYLNLRAELGHLRPSPQTPLPTDEEGLVKLDELGPKRKKVPRMKSMGWGV